jgi:hypothetical protein
LLLDPGDRIGDRRRAAFLDLEEERADVVAGPLQPAGNQRPKPVGRPVGEF